jgi:hypothetical protein
VAGPTKLDLVVDDVKLDLGPEDGGVAVDGGEHLAVEVVETREEPELLADLVELRVVRVGQAKELLALAVARVLAVALLEAALEGPEALDGNAGLDALDVGARGLVLGEEGLDVLGEDLHAAEEVRLEVDVDLVEGVGGLGPRGQQLDPLVGQTPLSTSLSEPTSTNRFSRLSLSLRSWPQA